MVLEVRLGGNEESSIFGAATAPENKDAVVLIVLNKGEFGTGFCGGCIGNKQEKICFKAS